MYKNISQKSYFLFIGILLLSISTIVYAETTEKTSSTSTETLSTSTNSDTIENISTSTDNNPISSTTESTATNTTVISDTEKSIIKQDQTSDQTPLSDIQQKRIINLCANVSNRLDATIARQENIAKRLNSRIVKMSESGINTTTAEAKLAEATITINTAKNTIKNIDTLINQTVTSPTPKTAWPSVRTTYTETETLVKQTQEELRIVIQLLKSPAIIPVEPNEETSTSTVEAVE